MKEALLMQLINFDPFYNKFISLATSATFIYRGSGNPWRSKKKLVAERKRVETRKGLR